MDCDTDMHSPYDATSKDKFNGRRPSQFSEDLCSAAAGRILEMVGRYCTQIHDRMLLITTSRTLRAFNQGIPRSAEVGGQGWRSPNDVWGALRMNGG